MDHRGFSLIETVVYVAVFTLFVAGLAGFSSSIISTRVRSQAMLEVNDQGATVMRMILASLRVGETVNSPVVGSSMPAASIATGVPATSPTVFSESGGVLYMTEGAGAPVALTNGRVQVSQLAFDNLSKASTPGIVRVRFTLTSGSYAIDFKGSAALVK